MGIAVATGGTKWPRGRGSTNFLAAKGPNKLGVEPVYTKVYMKEEYFIFQMLTCVSHVASSVLNVPRYATTLLSELEAIVCPQYPPFDIFLLTGI